MFPELFVPYPLLYVRFCRVVVIVFRTLYAIIRQGFTRSAMRCPTSISARRSS